MTALQRRITMAICVIVGLSLLTAAGLTFLVAPMADGLNLSDGDVEEILAIPSVGSLLAVFSAGYLGDRFGQRRTLALSAVGFSAGAVVLATANGAFMVEIGLAMCAASAITLQIVGVSLLQRATVEGRAQVSAFTTYGMIFPLAFLILPVVTAAVLGLANWRLVPLLWVLAGVCIWILVLTLLQRDDPVGVQAEWLTPLLAGIALAGSARAVAELSHVEKDPRTVIVGALVALGAGLPCLLLVRSQPHPGLTFAAVSDRTMRVLLLAVGLVSFVGLLTFVSIAMEYFYDMTPFQASLAVIPAQIGAIIGAKVVATWAIRRWGGTRASRALLFIIAIAMLPLLGVQADTPAWYLVGIAAIFSCAGMGALTVLNAEVMRRAPAASTGSVSSFRTAASSIGAAFGVAVFGTLIISAVQVDAGITAVSLAQLEELAERLRMVGAISSAAALLGGLALLRVLRRQTN